MINIRELSIYIKNTNILDTISLQLKSKKITCLIGKSGAGKTTLLKSIAGLVPTAHGDILVDGIHTQSLNPYQRAENIGYVFQDFNLFPHLTALENCMDPLIVHGASYDQAYRQAARLLETFDMDKWRNAYPPDLSGGQKQRIAIARALSLHPKAILLDEPTASLDPSNTDRLIASLRSLAGQGLTILLSSQDMSFVRKIADSIYYLEQGKLLESCTDIKTIEACTMINAWLNESA